MKSWTARPFERAWFPRFFVAFSLSCGSVALALLVGFGGSSPALAIGADSLRVYGTVSLPGDKPAPGATVTLTPATPEGAPDPAGTPLVVKSSKKGKFTIPFVKPGEYLFDVEVEGWVASEITIKMRDRDRRVPLFPDGSRLEDLTSQLDPAEPQARIAIPSIVLEVSIDVVLGEPPKQAAAPAAPMDFGEEANLARDAYSKITGGQVDEGLAEVETLLQGEPENGSLHYMKGFALLKKGALAEAEASLATAARFGPDLPGIWGTYGRVLAQNGNFDGAIDALGRELTRVQAPAERAPLLLALGGSYLEMGRAEEAVPVLEEARAISPENEQIPVQLVDAYTRAGREADAEALIGGLASKDAATLHFNLAGNYLRQKRYEDGIEHMRAALALDPSLGICHRFIGEAQASLGRFEEAVTSYKSYLEAVPDAGDREDVLRILEAYRQLLEKRPKS